MANAPQGPLPAKLTVEQMLAGAARFERLIDDVEAFDERQISKRNGPEIQAMQKRIEGVLQSVLGHDTIEYNRFRGAIRLDVGPLRVGSMLSGGRGANESITQARTWVAEGKVRSVVLLREAAAWLRDEAAHAEPQRLSAVPTSKTAFSERSNNIFIVHGHDGEAREAVARFIAAIGLNPIVLNEKANQGKAVIEKFETYGSAAGFAVVLVTPDDEGRRVGTDNLQRRARQNVILELGYFMGALGRDKVCAMATTRDIELPSDLGGIVTEPFDTASPAWKMSLTRELQAAGYDIDWNKAMK